MQVFLEKNNNLQVDSHYTGKNPSKSLSRR